MYFSFSLVFDLKLETFLCGIMNIKSHEDRDGSISCCREEQLEFGVILNRPFLFFWNGWEGEWSHTVYTLMVIYD